MNRSPECPVAIAREAVDKSRYHSQPGRSSAQTPLLNRPRPAPVGTNYPDPRGSFTRCCVEDLAVVH